MNYTAAKSLDFSRKSSFTLKHKFRRIIQEESFRKSNYEKFQTLTKREIEIIILITNDFNNPQIAHKLNISRCTVEQHRKNINRKLEINTPFQLFKYALAFDLI